MKKENKNNRTDLILILLLLLVALTLGLLVGGALGFMLRGSLGGKGKCPLSVYDLTNDKDSGNMVYYSYRGYNPEPGYFLDRETGEVVNAKVFLERQNSE